MVAFCGGELSETDEMPAVSSTGDTAEDAGNLSGVGSVRFSFAGSGGACGTGSGVWD